MAGYFGEIKDSDYWGDFFASSDSPVSSGGYFGELRSSDYWGEFWSNTGSGGLPVYISRTERANPSDVISVLNTPTGVTWPYQLPLYVERNGFTYTLSASSFSTKMSTGYDKRRKRYSGQYATYTVSLLMTLEELDLFEQFFNNNLGYGVVSFNFPDPMFISDYITVRIKSGADDFPYEVTPYSSSGLVRLTFVLERTISGYNTVAVTEWPSALPECPLNSGYVADTQSGIIRDADYAFGNIDVRRRFTAVIRKHNLTYILTRDQLEIFFDFFASLGYGSLTFTAPYPPDTTQTMRARFDTSTGSGYTVEYYGETDLFQVSFIWEELPLLKEYE